VNTPIHYFVIFSQLEACSPVRRFRDFDSALAGFHEMSKDPFYLEQPAIIHEDDSPAGVYYTDGKSTITLEAHHLTKKAECLLEQMAADARGTASWIRAFRANEKKKKKKKTQSSLATNRIRRFAGTWEATMNKRFHGGE